MNKNKKVESIPTTPTTPFRFSREVFERSRKDELILSAHLPVNLITMIEELDCVPHIKHKTIDVCAAVWASFYERNERDMKAPLSLCSESLTDVVGSEKYYDCFSKILVEELKVFRIKKLPNGTEFSTKDHKCKRYQIAKEFYEYSDYDTVFYVKRFKPGSTKVSPPAPNNSIIDRLHQDLMELEVNLTPEKRDEFLERFERTNYKDFLERIREKYPKQKSKYAGKKRTKSKTYSKTAEHVTDTEPAAESTKPQKPIMFIYTDEYENDKEYKATSKEELARRLTNQLLQHHTRVLSVITNKEVMLKRPFRDPKSGRLYHDFITLPSPYWKYVTLNGEPLVELDMSNCQPLLISHAIKRAAHFSTKKDYLIKNTAKYLMKILTDQSREQRVEHITDHECPCQNDSNGQISNEYYNISNNYNIYKINRGKAGKDSRIAGGSPTDLIELDSCLDCIVDFDSLYRDLFCHLDTEDGMEKLELHGPGKDLVEWVTAAIKGELYRTKSGQIYPEAPYSQDSINKTKKATMAFMFADPSTALNQKALQDMIPKYSHTTYFLNAVKDQMGRYFATLGTTHPDRYKLLLTKLKPEHRTPTKKGSVLFCVAIQTMESYIFIDNILPRLQQVGIKAIPKHDAMLVKKSDYDKARQIMEEVLLGFFGRDKDDNPNFHLK